MSEAIRKELSRYNKEDIVITRHAELQALKRNIELNEVYRNILNPKNLYYVEVQECQGPNERKYNCYFQLSRTQIQRYIIILNKKCKVCTVIKIKRKPQKRFNKAKNNRKRR